jgi:Ca-activated chloride channel family protein
MTFARPLLLWLVVLAPLAGAAAAWLWRRRHREIRLWAARGLWDRLLPGFDRRRLTVSTFALALSLGAVGIALAGPRWGQTLETVERRGIDVVFVLDASLSMAARDVAPSRFVVAQALVRRLAADLPGHRVALIEFEGEPVVLAPLTTDVAVLDLLLDTLEPGALPRAGSRLAPALAAAIDLFPPGDKSHRAIVLVTDGEDHEGQLEPVLRRLREEGVVVNVLAVGTAAGAPLPTPGGAANEFKRDRDGRVVMSRVDTTALAALASETGGVLVEATHASADPGPITERIGAIETRALDTEELRAGEERFQWPLGIAAALLLAHLAIPAFRREP